MDIVVNRGFVTTLDQLKPYSIALDGFCPGPQVDAENHRFSFDHHEKCLRYCTTSSCLQAWTAIQLGLEDIEKYTIYCNDVDIDVGLAVWVLKNSERSNEPLVKKLVYAVSEGDCHLGAISANGMGKIIDYISFPEMESKKQNDYNKISNEGLETILEATMHRVDLYVNGESGDIKSCKNHEYKILHSEPNWTAVESKDSHVYSALYHAGFSKICKVDPQSDGSNAITIVKKSDFVSGFNINRMCEELNALEPGWGGNNIVIGAPRNKDGSRSRLELSTIYEIINKNCN